MSFSKLIAYLRPVIIQAGALSFANIKVRYRGSWAGVLWVILNPIILFGAQSYAFHYILKLNVSKFPLFLMTGLIPWIFISQTLEMSATVIMNHGRLIKSFQIEPAVFVYALVFENLVNFIIAFILSLAIVVYLSEGDIVNFLIFPIPMLILFFFTFSLAWLISGITVLYYDLKFIVNFIMTISFFITPIFYPIEFVPEEFRWIPEYNIFYHTIIPFRKMITDPYSIEFIALCAKALCISFVIFVIALYFWRKNRNVIYKNF